MEYHNKSKIKQERRRRPLNPPERLAWPAGGNLGLGSSLGDVPQMNVSSYSCSSSQTENRFAPTDTPTSLESKESSSSFNLSSFKPKQSLKQPKISKFREGRGHRRRHFEKNADTISANDFDHPTRGNNKRSQPSKSSSSSMLWVDKYSPTNDSSELCVAPKKVRDVREWIVRAMKIARSTGEKDPGGTLASQEDAEPGGGDQSKMLILVGSPGIGKSTMVRVLAAEMGWTIHQWNESYQSFSGNKHYNRCGSGDIMPIPYQSPLASFENFLKCAGVGFSALNVTSPERRPAAYSNRFKPKYKGTKRKLGEIETNGALLLIEEIPNLHNHEAEEKFRAIMSEHIRRTNIPSIIIYSDTCEGKHKPEDLESIVDPCILYSSLVQIMQCHSVTKARMKKCLQTIARKEGIRSIPEDFLEETHSTSGGDIRHAIMALQFQLGADKKQVKRIRQQDGLVDSNQVGDYERDTRLSTFHALGKLLYAKRKTCSLVDGRRNQTGLQENYPPGQRRLVNGKSSPLEIRLLQIDSRPPLDFIPEDVINQSTIGQGGALSFLQHHGPEFFTDATELSEAFDYFSDAALFLDRSIDPQRDQSDSVFPSAYVSSLAGRSVARTNKHPAASRFRSFGAPKMFDVMRKKRGNDIKMLQLCKRLSVGSEDIPLDANIGSSKPFVTDLLPFMRTILPSEVNSALDNLYSYVRPDMVNNTTSENSDDLVSREMERQRLILADDDIVEDDSADENPYPENAPEVFMVNKQETMTAKRGETLSPTSTVDGSAPAVYPEIITIDD